MASLGAKNSETASIAVAPASSQVDTEPETTSHLVQQVSTIEQLDELLGDGARVILIEFFAEWCGPCIKMAQKLEEWAGNYDVIIAKIDIDELEDVAIEYNVAGIPSLVFIKERQVLEHLEGSQEDKIIAALEKYCKVTKNVPVKKTKGSKKKNAPAMSAAKDISAANTPTTTSPDEA